MTADETQRGSQWIVNLVSQGMPFLVFVMATPILIRYVGSERFGALMLMSLVPQIAGQLDLGLATAGTLGIAQEFAKCRPASVARIARELAFAVSALSAFWGGIVISVGPGFLNLFKINAEHGVPDAYSALPALALWTALSVACIATSAPLRALERFQALAFVQAVGGTTFWVGAVVAAKFGAGLPGIVMWGAVTAGASVVFATLLTWNEFAVTNSTESTTVSGEGRLMHQARVGLGAFISQATSLATFHADKFAVSAIVSPEAAGAYAVCANVASKLLTLTSAVSVFAFPRAARMIAERANAALLEIHVHATRVGVLTSAMFAVPLIALASPLLHVWMGSKFTQDYAVVLQLLALGNLFAAFSPVASNIAAGAGKTLLNASFAVLGAALTLGFIGLLAPAFGIYGAAIATCIGMSQAIVFNAVVGVQVLRGGAEHAGGVFLGHLIAVMLLVGIPALVCGGLIRSGALARSVEFAVICMIGVSACLTFVALWFALGFASRSERDIAHHYIGAIRK